MCRGRQKKYRAFGKSRLVVYRLVVEIKIIIIIFKRFIINV